MIIETNELNISDELKRKVELICRFANVDYTFTNGNIKNIKNTNIAYAKLCFLIAINCNSYFQNFVMKIKKSIANFIETSFQQNLPRPF